MRSKFEIISEILGVCRTPKLISHITQSVGLSYTGAKAYIKLLRLHRCIDVVTVKGRTHYKRSKFGSEFHHFLDVTLSVWQMSPVTADMKVSVVSS